MTAWSPLADSLDVAVTLRILEIRQAGGPTEADIGASRKHAQTIAAHGDDLQYGGPHIRQAFTATAEALAVLAYQPGGVQFLGRKWDAS